MDRRSDNLRGALFMVVGMAGFGLNDALIKLTAGELTLFQAIFLRGLFATALVAGLAGWRRALDLRTIAGRDRRLVALRAFGETGATLCFLYALFHMPLANATAIVQAVPLALTVAAALVLGERVGWRRATAAGLGFVGVLIIVRPGFAGFTAYSLSAMGAVGFLVLRDLATRRLSAAVPSLTVTLITAASITAMGGIGVAAGSWQPVAPGHVALLATAAVFLFVGYLFMVKTMRVGDVGFVAPFRYTILLWAVLAGIVLFDEWPDAWTLAGSALIVATGLYTLHRERRRASPREAPRDAPRDSH